MTRKELLERYEEIKENKDLQIALYIHMPDDSIEIIYNENAHEKIKYIMKTYDASLTHSSNTNIYIVDALFASENVKDNLDFGSAIKNIRHGDKMTRKGWNGKGMYIYYVPQRISGSVQYRDYIAMKTTDGSIVPWLASQTDILARDWMIVDEDD